VKSDRLIDPERFPHQDRRMKCLAGLIPTGV
jgi:hypothetical protein